jgi:hypothetical protein
MASENTAIHDLLAGLQRKPVNQDPDDDVLFAGSRRDDAGPRRVPRGTEPPPNLFAMPPPPVAGPLPPAQLAVSLPRPFLHQPSVGTDKHLATSRVSRTAATRTNKKLYFVPAGLAIVAAVLVAILMGNKDDQAVKVAASGVAAGDKPAEVIALEAANAAKVATPPSVTPITEPAAAAAAPSVTPITEPAAAPAAVAALPKDAVAPAEVVPASAFVASQDGTTVPTVPTAPAAAAATTETEAPAAVAEESPAPKAKKSRRELAREKRAAKRATKRTTKREPKQVARAEKAEKTDSKLNGNGALAVSSSQPREVWVDGRNSKRMTPVRVLLKPGKHKVTLFDKAKGTAKTFEVEIKPNTTTKVAK